MSIWQTEDRSIWQTANIGLFSAVSAPNLQAHTVCGTAAALFEVHEADDRKGAPDAVVEAAAPLEIGESIPVRDDVVLPALPAEESRQRLSRLIYPEK